MKNILSKEDIYIYGEKARNDFTEVRQNCYKIINRFIGYLQDYCNLGWNGEISKKYQAKEIRVGPEGEEKHYILEIDGLLIKEYNKDETLFVDLSFDQFNKSNKKSSIDIEVSYGEKENIDGIQIVEKNSKKAERYKNKSILFREYPL